ncbi:hypothetical protein JCM16303_007292 [Sporobolomyces ruberrimus]
MSVPHQAETLSSYAAQPGVAPAQPTTQVPVNQVPASEPAPVVHQNEAVTPAATNGTAVPAAAAAPEHPVLDEKEIKHQEKEHKQLEKKLHKEEKKENKQVEAALKNSREHEKKEAKAAKAEAKARKAVEKATNKEAKAARKLVKAQETHDKSTATLTKAKNELALREQEKQRLLAERDPKLAALHEQQALKKEHDAARQNTLKRAAPPSVTA